MAAHSRSTLRVRDANLDLEVACLDSTVLASWRKSVADRRSVRVYDGRSVDSGTLGALEDLCRDHLTLSGGAARLDLVSGRDEADRVFSWLLGPLLRVIRGATLTCLIVTSPDKDWHDEEAGFVGQQLVLEATRLGLGTCWVSGTYNRKTAVTLANLQVDEHLACVIALGRPLSGSTGQSKRKTKKSIEAICGKSREALEPWQFEALEYARLAPSAVNFQPWWFEVSEDGRRPRVVLYDHNPRARRPWVRPTSGHLDRGIAMLNFLVGAASAGVLGEWRMLAGSGGRGPVAEYVIKE